MEQAHFLHIIAEAIGSTVKNGVIEVPAHMGSGFLRGVKVHDQLSMIVRHYELKYPWRQKTFNKEKGILMIAFHNILSGKGLPSAQVTTIDWAYEVVIPANVSMSSVVMLVHTDYLKGLLQGATDRLLNATSDSLQKQVRESLEPADNLLQAITSGHTSFLLEELISPRIQDVAGEVIKAQPPLPLQALFFRAKAEELIYLLFVELLKRNEPTVGAINTEDAKMIYQVKERVLASLEEPPQITALARFAGMSESKLQRVFKQVFGNTIYNYYQSFRMREAAQLMHEQGVSVSAAAYKLGFTNLSRFTRLFETHMGVKPKKYAGLKK